MFIVSISIIATEGNGGVMTRRAQRRVVAGDEKTWQLARQSLEEFQAAIPEHRGYHRLVDKDEVARVCQPM